MSAFSFVLPRVRTRKRKRRPMRFDERVALFQVLWCGMFAGLDFYFTVNWLHTLWPLGVFDAACCVYLLRTVRRYWPILWNYIRNGYVDE